MKKNLDLWAITTAVVFLTPWLHRLAFENITRAVPGMNVDAAHAVALFLPLAGLIFAGFATGRLEP
jgi:hypothetical protein